MSQGRSALDAATDVAMPLCRHHSICERYFTVDLERDIIVTVSIHQGAAERSVGTTQSLR